MITNDLNITCEFVAAVLTILYIGKLLLQRDEINRFYNQLAPTLTNSGIPQLKIAKKK